MDLRSKGFGVLHTAQWLMSLVVLVVIAYAGWLWWEGRLLEMAAQPYEASTHRAMEASGTYVKQARQAGYDLSEERLKGLEQEVAFTNQMVAKHAFSWTRFLTDLEEAVPPHISIGSVGLSLKDKVYTIQLSGAASSLRDLTKFVNSLEAHPAFQQVVLSHHQKRPQEALQKVAPNAVEFSLTVTYRPRLV